jgi:hypothetical protein
MNSMMSTSVLATAVIIFEEAVRYTLGKLCYVGGVRQSSAQTCLGCEGIFPSRIAHIASGRHDDHTSAAKPTMIKHMLVSAFASKTRLWAHMSIPAALAQYYD